VQVATKFGDAAAVHPIAAVQFEWSMLWRKPEHDIIPAARQLGVGLVPYSPLGRGLLSATLDRQDIDASEFRRTDPRFQDSNLAHDLAQLHALRSAAESLEVTTGQLALAWLIRSYGG
jgi:aryl-alcohol dehydrogenase-like predicted oxidoreductase